MISEAGYANILQVEDGDPVVAIQPVRVENSDKMVPAGAKGVVDGALNMPGLDHRIHRSFVVKWTGEHDGYRSVISSRFFLKKVQFNDQ